MSQLPLRRATSEDEPAVRPLLPDSGLQPHFQTDEFLVAQMPEGNRVGGGRLRPLADGASEIGSIAVAPTHRRTGLGAHIVEAAMARDTGPVYGLSLVSKFLRRLGFHALQRVPDSLQDRASSACGSYQHMPMVRYLTT